MHRPLLSIIAVTLLLPPILGQEPVSPKASGVADVAEKASVKPGINDRFLDPELEVQEWIDRFEVESREVYHARKEVMQQLDLQTGDRIADVGAGTGFFSLLMSEAVGESGWVFAVEIVPRFVQHLSSMFDQRSVGNVTTVMGEDDSICLPPESIDVAFICDVYHHFEFPDETMASIHRALRKDGRVIVIDFERIPGVSREWTLGHVRAGKQTFTDEIESVGFGLIAEHEIPGFEENYFLEFRKR